VLAIGLDGFELSLGERLMAEGRMPHLAALRSRSARFRLDHGLDKYSGLTWEHVSSGIAPRDGGRWSAVAFDPRTYEARQEATRARPFLADLSGQAVVFDLPYCDLAAAPGVRGLTSWGAHDPGVAAFCRPAGLLDEMTRRFGPYPAEQWIYGFTWPSPARTRTLGEALTRAVEVRAAAAEWLFAEAVADWQLAMVVVSEAHSVSEPLWHGIDPTHRLHGLASAAPAAASLDAVYQAIDGLVGRLVEAFPAAEIAVFAMHGMGANDADVACMLLLPELLFRHAFGRPHLREPRWRDSLEDGTPLLAEDESWEQAVAAFVPPGFELSRWRRAAARLPWRRAATRPAGLDYANLSWMPATRYAAFWPSMPAFALPSFYDGRIRINLAGRESRGVVTPRRYGAVRDEIVELLQACRDPLSGETVVESVHFPTGEPARLGSSEADISVIWRRAPLGLAHPRHGRIGPVPFRRTGGHTGDSGFLFAAGADIAPGDRGWASSFDLVPTLVRRAGLELRARTSGAPLDLPTASRPATERRAASQR
jgi:predicted AlkP superfamily phosphohydrolase/phosphomutase